VASMFLDRIDIFLELQKNFTLGFDKVNSCVL